MSLNVGECAMEVLLFLGVSLVVVLLVVAMGPLSGPQLPARSPMHVRVGDIPEGEMHVAELAVLASVLGMLAVLVASVLVG